VLCEGGTIDVANAISNYMNMVMTCCFYAPLLPQAIPIAFLGSAAGYWATKYNLLRRCKMPDAFSELMASFFGNLMPWLVLANALSAYFFIFELKGSIYLKLTAWLVEYKKEILVKGYKQDKVKEQFAAKMT
jgi:hypothetical protein